MALSVEDGTGRADAESYCSVAEATSYHNKRAKGDAWDAVEDKEAALRNATDYMLAVYRPLWIGSRLKYQQSLDWPRIDAQIEGVSGGGYGYYPPNYPTDQVPALVKNACAELALRDAGLGGLMTDEDRETVRETVGPITVQYKEGGTRQLRYAMVDSMISTLLNGSSAGSSIKLFRA